MEEVFRTLTDGIWSDLDKLPDPKDAKDPVRSANVIKFFDWAYKNGSAIATR